MIRIEITDLGATDRMEVIRLAKFLLEYTGFEAPVQQSSTSAAQERGMMGQNTPYPRTRFTPEQMSSQQAATQYTPAPPIPTAPVANPFAGVTDVTPKAPSVVIPPPPPPAPERKTLAEHYALPPL